jgi:hypothetical protein
MAIDATPWRHPELHGRLRAYVEAAFAYLGRSDPRSLSGYRSRRWLRRDDTSFAEEDVVVPFVDSFLERATHSTPEYVECIAFLQSDPVIAPQLNTLVGADSAIRIDLRTLTDGLVARLAAESGLIFDPQRFHELYVRVEKTLIEPTVTVTLMMPLGGFESDRSLKLDSGVEIALLPDEEITRCLTLGIFSPMSTTFPIAHRLPKYAIFVREAAPKEVGDRASTPPKQYLERRERMVETMDRVIHALRLFKRGRFVPVGRVQFDDNAFMGGGGAYERLTPMSWVFGDYNLSEEDVTEFEQFWRSMSAHGVRQTKYLDIAIRRFSYKDERRLPEDQIVDLMIAAEALFLSGSGDEATRGEQRYRLALRAGSFVESDRWSHYDVFKLMRMAYDVRSAVVHGGTPDKIKLPDGAKTDMSELIVQVQEVLRLAIVKTIELARQQGSALKVDWEDSLISRSPRERLGQAQP